ncbi:WD-40 repeat protein, partial [Reticulomyxa filosa]
MIDFLHKKTTFRLKIFKKYLQIVLNIIWFFITSFIIASKNTFKVYKSFIKLHFLFQHEIPFLSLNYKKSQTTVFKIFETPFITLERKKVKYLPFYIIKNDFKKKNKMTTLALSEEEKIQVIVQHWIRRLKKKLGWINEFDKLVVNYVSSFVHSFFKTLMSTVFMFETFCSSSKLINTLTEHTGRVWSIDYSTFDDCQLICSGSDDKTVRVWDVDNNKQIQSFNGHSDS